MEHARGRDEHRTYYVCEVPADPPDGARWKGLKRIGLAISESRREGESTDAARYYILSKRMSVRSFAAAARDHWVIEIPRSEDRRCDNLCVGRQAPLPSPPRPCSRWPRGATCSKARESTHVC